MLNNENIISIEKLLNNSKIINSEILSDSFGINCIKLNCEKNKIYVVKFYKDKKDNFDAIDSERRNLVFLNNLDLKIFPKLYSNSSKYLIVSYFNNNELKPKETRNDLLKAITSIHSKKDKKFGFNFDTQIGGLRQINKRTKNWVDFFKFYRLGYIYELINKSSPMNNNINKKIEYLLNNLENFIPKTPNPSLLHGDLWEGNILFNNYNFVAFIDPGSFYGHNELEVAYLRWFNPKFIDNNFIEKYSNVIKIDKEYFNYEPIYQLYYSLLNVYLWDKGYEKDVSRLVKEIGI